MVQMISVYGIRVIALTQGGLAVASAAIVLCQIMDWQRKKVRGVRKFHVEF